MAERSIRDFQVSFAVAPIADAWAGANGFALSSVEPDGSRHYVRGSGLLTGQMMCVVRQFGPHVRVEAYVHARMVARLSALFLIPENMSVEPGRFVGGLPRKMCRDAVDRLLAQLGQPPISATDNVGSATGVPQAPPARAAMYPRRTKAGSFLRLASTAGLADRGGSCSGGNPAGRDPPPGYRRSRHRPGLSERGPGLLVGVQLPVHV